LNIYRLHKYDPKYRDQAGYYTRDEWTCFSDVGRTYSGERFTLEDYVHVEDNYVKAIELIMRDQGSSELKVYADGIVLRKKDFLKSRLLDIELSDAMSFHHGDWISGKRIALFCRLSLRNLCGYALTDERGFLIAFSDEYYVHLGGAPIGDFVIRKIEKLGLFVEFKGKLGDKNLDNERYLKLLPHAPNEAESNGIG
jgi:hypothetical protein